MKKNKARNLPPVRFQVPGDDSHQPLVLQFSQDAERRRLGTPWFLTKGGYLRVTVAIIGPKSRCPQGEFPLSRRQAEDTLQELTNTIIALKEELLGEDAVRC